MLFESAIAAHSTPTQLLCSKAASVIIHSQEHRIRNNTAKASNYKEFILDSFSARQAKDLSMSCSSSGCQCFIPLAEPLTATGGVKTGIRNSIEAAIAEVSYIRHTF